VTLLRRSPAAVLPTCKALRWDVSSFVLLESVPGEDYRVMAEWPLGD